MNNVIKYKNKFSPFIFQRKISTLPNSMKNDYEIMKTIVHKEKKKNFRNIFLCVSLINISTFIFTVHNYYIKKDPNYFSKNDINIIDHIILNNVVSSLGLNNLSLYIKNGFYTKLVNNIKNENYSAKENALLSLLELLYKNKNCFVEIIENYKNENADILKYIFEKIKNDKLENTQKNVFSSIIFYYIKYSSGCGNTFLTYDQIWELVFNKNLFQNHKDRDEIISYLLLNIFKNEKYINEVIQREQKIWNTEMDEHKNNQTNDNKIKGNNEIDKNNNLYSNETKSIIHFLIYCKYGKTAKNSNPILKFYLDITKNNENYYKEETLNLFEKYFNKLNIPFFLEKNDNMEIEKKKSYSNIINKIYIKYFENTVLYTFFFSFALHNIYAKEYTIKTYLYILNDIFKSIYINTLINSIFLVQKSVINNIDINNDTPTFFSLSLLFNLLNSTLFSYSIYKCKYGFIPLVFSQIVKDNFFL
ncbi:conserved Plasmodium protein, unknown function [Plasmodium yoelii]|uniref:Uncharacterized protein n=1 Tax=Plasmodium yoelii TaxID=5861 RepID=A0A078KLK3_PLAYE|nr:conserved Plasmodium protein, unknown function [Plasmodium yoelii]CDU20197.1 conserved Plasmodium protein, unknown function [Plasmodium yoelii]VTZ80955.1 conserved Plasmodium protein, unknown function [Plasmodium yoelii]|eukprot:XP_022813726.1 conserved Plasmodium protein, unknown function [Plasmodium yoelii]